MPVTRDQKEQTKFKKALVEESIAVFGKNVCWLSMKPYRDLIASHIKPFKLCAIEGDEKSKFNPNNGLLLSKDIDAYFDKFDITFDDEGNILFSDNVDPDIKQDLSCYKLDERIYNKYRRENMNIHRSLFFYIHYFNRSIGSRDINGIDLNLKYLKKYNEFIILGDNVEIVPSNRVKKILFEKANFKTTMSNCSLCAVLKKNDDIISNKIISRTIYSTPNGCFDITKLNFVNPKDYIVVNHFDVNIVFDPPKRFLDFLNNAFGDERNVEAFQIILGKSLSGEGFSNGICLYGDYQTSLFVFEILERVLGRQLLKYGNSKLLYKKFHTPEQIRNCNILVVENRNTRIDSNNLYELITNTLFTKSILNVLKYIVFLISEYKIYEDNIINLRVYKTELSPVILEKIIRSECDSILGWIIEGFKKFDKSILDALLQVSPDSNYSAIIEKWISNRCILDRFESTNASTLFRDYLNYCENKNYPSVSQTMFGRYMGLKFKKRNTGRGISYLGIFLK